MGGESISNKKEKAKKGKARGKKNHLSLRKSSLILS